MNRLILLIAKISKIILKFKGGGTSYPGDLALKLNKNILSYFKQPKITIFVTGTTGKTTVSETLYEIFKNAGYKTVSNIKGSNLIAGVTSVFIDASKLNGKSKVDVLIAEVDERYVKEVMKYITPTHFVINNLSRDQLARNGHFELVFKEIDNAIKDETHLILNADDPLVCKFGLNKKNQITYYGIAENKFSKKKNLLNTLDLAYCPICHKKLEFLYFNYGNLGNYSCPSGDYNRPTCDYEASIVKNGFKIDGNSISLTDNHLYQIYNMTACYSVAKLCKVDTDSIISTLENLSLKVKRLNEFNINGVNTTILLSKNETPLSYNQSLEYVTSKKGMKTVAIGFKRISGRYDLKDISWLYDINFELLNNKDIERIILIGPFAYDIATRLKLAKVDTKKIMYCFDTDNSLDYAVNNSKGDLYCVVYFDLDYQYLDQIKERGIK